MSALEIQNSFFRNSQMMDQSTAFSKQNRQFSKIYRSTSKLARHVHGTKMIILHALLIQVDLAAIPAGLPRTASTHEMPKYATPLANCSAYVHYTKKVTSHSLMPIIRRVHN
jgi:hypothetical protein